MQAAFVKRTNKVELRQIPIVSPKKSAVLLKINSCGICGSDFIEAKSWARKWKRFGHEIVATVAETGPDVSGFAVGDQVVVALSAPCGACARCRNGNPRKCNNLITAEQGGFAEYLMVEDQRLLYKVNPNIPTELASFAEPLTVILDAFHLTGLCKDDHLLVIGGGFLGMLTVLTAKALEIDVRGVLNRKTFPELMTCLNAANAGHFLWRTVAGKTIAAPSGLQKELSELTGRVVVLHTVPPCYLSLYLDALPYDSTIINIGLSASKHENRFKIDASKLIFKRTQIMSAFPVPCLHLPQAALLLWEHAELFSLLATEKIPLNRLPEVFTSLKSSKRKILITP